VAGKAGVLASSSLGSFVSSTSPPFIDIYGPGGDEVTLCVYFSGFGDGSALRQQARIAGATSNQIQVDADTSTPNVEFIAFGLAPTTVTRVPNYNTQPGTVIVTAKVDGRKIIYLEGLKVLDAAMAGTAETALSNLWSGGNLDLITRSYAEYPRQVTDDEALAIHNEMINE
jgi:hypothetical protein